MNAESIFALIVCVAAIGWLLYAEAGRYVEELVERALNEPLDERPGVETYTPEPTDEQMFANRVERWLREEAS